MLLKFTDWGKAANFFIYDSIKIIFLLFLVIFFIGVIRTYLSQRKIKLWMNKKHGAGNFFAAVFGAITPFCSCSSIPLFLGFIKAGVPLGISFSFLITSPIINEYLVVLMLGFFGWKITALYVINGLLMGTTAGMILGRMNLERYLVNDVIKERIACCCQEEYTGFMSRIKFGYHEAVSIVKKIWVWIFVGVGVGAVIHNYVPQEIIQSLIGKAGAFSVPIAVILGTPMYGSCAAIVPIAVVLFQKGIPLGTALAFMMAVSALSLPEAILLRRVMRINLIAVFFAVTVSAIIFIGYLFNFLQNILR